MKPGFLAPASIALALALLLSGCAPLNLGSNSKAGAPNSTSASASPSLTSVLSSDQISAGLKEALRKGLDQAVAQLGRQGGFMSNLNVRIPMPQQLQTVEKIARQFGQDKFADDFIAAMNQAAEKAVPAAAPVFADAVRNMSVANARAILDGPDNAATEYFKSATSQDLSARFLPIVQEATAKTGVTSAYKQLLSRAKFASPFLKTEPADVDAYVTDKAMDGLFKLVAEEEKRIRENPVARSTELLQRVFGMIRK